MSKSIIYKYKLNSPGETELMLPRGAEILKVMPQHFIKCTDSMGCGERILVQELNLWAIVDTEEKLEKRIFVVVLTGQELPLGCSIDTYFNTYQEGEFVGHVFELSRSPKLVPDLPKVLEPAPPKRVV